MGTWKTDEGLEDLELELAAGCEDAGVGAGAGAGAEVVEVASDWGLGSDS